MSTRHDSNRWRSRYFVLPFLLLQFSFQFFLHYNCSLINCWFFRFSWRTISFHIFLIAVFSVKTLEYFSTSIVFFIVLFPYFPFPFCFLYLVELYILWGVCSATTDFSIYLRSANFSVFVYACFYCSSGSSYVRLSRATRPRGNEPRIGI